MAEKTEYIISLKDLFSKGTRDAESAAIGLENRVNSLQSTLAKIGAAVGVATLAKGIFDAGTNMESLNVSLKTMLGSKGEADKLVAEMVKFAATTPFEQSEVQTAGKLLLAYGVSAKDVIPTLRSLGDVSAGLAQPIGEIAYLYGTIKTQGKAMTVDIRQFANRGIPIYEELAKVTGKSGQALQDMIEKGKIGFPEIQKAFENMSGAGGKFAGLTKELAQTTGGQWSNMKDQLYQLAVTVFKELQPAINWLIRGISWAIEKVKVLIDFIKRNLSVFKALALAIGTVATSIFLYNKYVQISTILSKAYAAFQGLQMVASLTGATTAQLALNAAMEANPIGLVIAALAALVAAISLVADHFKELENTYKKVGEEFKAQKVSEETKRVLQLADAYKKQGLTRKEAEEMALAAEEKRINAQIRSLAITYEQQRQALAKLALESSSNPMLALLNKGKTDEALKNLHAAKGALDAAVAQKGVLKKSTFETASSANAAKAIDTGTSNVQAKTHNVITINIDKLIEKLNINTTTMTEGIQQTKENLLKALIEAVNDSQIVAGQ